jgi:hypothetical protein
MDNYELRKEDGQWKLQQQGAGRAIRVFPTKDKGLDFSTKYVGEHGGSLKIKKENGQRFAYTVQRGFRHMAPERVREGQ